MTATDDAGNISTCTFQVIVEDNTAPVITVCAPDVIEQVNGACSFSLPSYTSLVSASDNCDASLSLVQSPAPGTVISGFGTTQLVTITVTDDNGNFTLCSFTVTLDDSINPVISCPASLTVSNDPSVCQAWVNVSAPVTDDNCSVVSVINDYTGTDDASAIYPVGTTTIGWTVTDIAGNTASCSMTVTVVDDEDPVVTCPSDITQTADAGTCDAAVNVDAPVTSDNCMIASVVNDFNNTADASGVYPVGTTSVVWTVTDIYGNSSECTMTVTITDDELPVITCPSNITISNDAALCSALVTVPSPVTSDNCAVASVANDFNNTANASGVYPVGTTTIVWTVTDVNGNSASCSMTVTVVDDEVPNLTCPSDITVGTDAGVCQAFVNVPVPGNSDECGIASVVNDYTGTADASAVYPQGTTLVTWTVTDIHGNISQCSINIVVNDTENPVITCPADITVVNDNGVCEAFVLVAAPVANDNCGIASVINDYNNSADASDVYPVGTTTVEWTVTDVHGNISTCVMTIVVQDMENPQITCPDDVQVNNDLASCGATINPGIPVVTDNCNVQSVINDYTGTNDATSYYPVGTTMVTWTATDIYGNQTSCTMNVIVVDNELPLITCPDDISVNNDNGACEAFVNVSSPVYSDNCAVASAINDYTGSNDASAIYPVGTTLVTWTVTDIYGNSATCAMSIVVTDNENPVITCPTDIQVPNNNGSCDAFVTVPTPAVNDNCSVESVINDYNSTADASDTYPVGTTTVLWTVTDIYGNSSTCTMNITVVDPENPVITCAADMTVQNDIGLCNATIVIAPPVVSDNCLIDAVTNSYNGTADASDTYPVGTTIITWTVTDIFGNMATCTQQITVEDNEAPAIICSADQTSVTDAGVCEGFVTVIAPTVEDNCAVQNLVNDYTGTDDASAVYPEGTTTITWTLTDIHGNVSSCTQNITVNDVELPSIICPTNIVVNTDAGVCEAFVTVPAPVTADNCDVSGYTNDYTNTPDASGIYPQGTTTVTWTVIDIHGNSSTCSMTIVVNDNEAPTIVCPENITVANDASSCSAVIMVPTPLVNDNCAVLSVVNDYTNTGDASSTYPVGSTTVTWTVTDVHGNITTCEQTIVVSDTEVPAIICAADITASNDAGLCEAFVTVPTPTVSDNCVVASVTNDWTMTDDASAVYPQGTTNITWTVTDIYGNQSTCVQMIVIDDSEAPVVECPAAIVAGNDNGMCDGFITVPVPVSTDNCGIASVISDYTGIADASAVYPEGTTTITWTIVDIHGNMTTCSTTVTVNDIEAAQVVCSGDITTTNDAGSCSALVNVESPVSTDNCGIATVVNDYNGTDNATDIYPVGSTSVTWTITDIHGNVSNCSQVITVQDLESPMITCPDDVTVINDAGLCSAVVNPGQPVVSDNCDIDNVINDYTGTSNASAVYPVGTTIITWTVTDIHGNSATCQMTVIVNDAEEPTVICPTDISATNDAGVCESFITIPVPASADNCEVESLINDYTGTEDASGTYPVGTTTVTYTVTDIHGNSSQCSFNVVVTDTENPTITCPPNVNTYIDAGACEAFVSIASPMVNDNCGVLFIENNYTGSADASAVYPVGSTAITWTVVDIYGNTNECEQIIVVADTEAPEITCPADIMVINETGTCESMVNVPGPLVTDNCAVSEITNDYTNTNDASGVYPVGTTVVTWTATDVFGNTSSCTMNIVVQDTETPTITCPENITTSSDLGACGANVFYDLPVANDNCGVASVVLTEGPASGSFFAVGPTIVTFAATDIYGNITECSFVVTVEETEDPVVVECPGELTFTNDPGECGAVVMYDIPAVTDNCGIADTTLFEGIAPGGFFPMGSTQVTYLFTDFFGNVGACTFTITVEDNEAPSVLCPQDTEVPMDEGECGAYVFYTLPAYVDNCGNATITLVEGLAPGSFFPGGTTTVSYDITDDAGNTYTCTFNITVVDNEAPVIDCPEDITQIDPIVYYEEPAFNDNCAAELVMIEGLESGDVFPHGYSVVTYVAIDLNGNTDTCSFTILVNTPPVAEDDIAGYTEEDDDIVIDVMDNDYDLDGDSIFVGSASASNGSVFINIDGTLTYEVNEGWCGIDTLTYILFDEYMASDTAIVTIIVECVIDLIIPEAISPNGDGINDVFEIIGLEDYPNNRLAIFNRWGHKVFDESQYKNDWDGTSQSPVTIGSSLLPKGTYYFVLDLGPNVKAVKGYIFLNR